MHRTRRVVSHRWAVAAAAGFVLAACGDTSPAAAPESLVPTPEPSFALNTPYNNAGQCMAQDLATFDKPGPVNCTANDIRIARADVSSVDGNSVVPNAPIQCTPGDPLTRL
jgi:hypothetical protein